MSEKELAYLLEDARTRANYLDAYSNTVAAAMYRGERPSGIWNLERAATLLREQADLLEALAKQQCPDGGEHE